jgi:hypothetical protein
MLVQFKSSIKCVIDFLPEIRRAQDQIRPHKMRFDCPLQTTATGLMDVNEREFLEAANIKLISVFTRTQWI